MLVLGPGNDVLLVVEESGRRVPGVYVDVVGRVVDGAVRCRGNPLVPDEVANEDFLLRLYHGQRAVEVPFSWRRVIAAVYSAFQGLSRNASKPSNKVTITFLLITFTFT